MFLKKIAENIVKTDVFEHDIFLTDFSHEDENLLESSGRVWGAIRNHTASPMKGNVLSEFSMRGNVLSVALEVHWRVALPASQPTGEMVHFIIVKTDVFEKSSCNHCKKGAF